MFGKKNGGPAKQPPPARGGGAKGGALAKLSMAEDMQMSVAPQGKMAGSDAIKPSRVMALKGMRKGKGK